MKFEPQGEGKDQCPSCPPLTSSGGGGRGARAEGQQAGFLGEYWSKFEESWIESGFTV